MVLGVGRILLILGAFLGPLGASVALNAATVLVVKKSITVYKSQSRDSQEILVLEKGDTVPISPKKYGNWKKVLVTGEDGKTSGWVLISDLKGSQITDADDEDDLEVPERSRKNRKYHGRPGLNLKIALSYMNQGARTYQDGSGSAVEISALSGISNFFGVGYDYPFSNKFVLRADLLLRTTAMSGSTNLQGQVKAQPLQLNQQFLGLGLLGKLYSGADSDFWYGAGAEVSKGTGVQLVYNSNSQVPVDTSTMPLFVLVQGAVGYDFHLAGDFYLLPEVRAGIVVNTKPIILNAEFFAGVAKSF